MSYVVENNENHYSVCRGSNISRDVILEKFVSTHMTYIFIVANLLDKPTIILTIGNI